MLDLTVLAQVANIIAAIAAVLTVYLMLHKKGR